jgi:hypothetical protein
MKTRLHLTLIFLLLTCALLAKPQYTKAQTNSNITNIPVFFHPNILVMNEENGSFRLYEGVNGLAPTRSTPTQVELNAQIYDRQTVFGFSIEYWSAIVVWAMRVPKDLHVDGIVDITAYISSSFEISGFTSGSGYTMGLVDINENNNTVQTFMVEPVYAVGENIFSPTPQQYSLSTTMDYVFRAGHTIGLMVGCGATEQGFTATVYFDSIGKPSGATLPVVDTSESYDFPAASEKITILSNSAIADYNYNSMQKTIQFTAKLIDYTIGHCDITVPKTLMQSPFSVTSGSQQMTPTVTETQTSYQISLTHTRNPDPIQVTGEASDNPTPTPSSSPTLPPTPISEPITPEPTLSPNPTSPSSAPTSTATNTDPTNGPALSAGVNPEIFLVVVIAVAAATIILVIRKKRPKASSGQVNNNLNIQGLFATLVYVHV